jgi:hypothetical protein
VERLCPPPPVLPLPFPAGTGSSAAGPWSPLPASGGAPGAPPGAPCMVPEGLMEKAPAVTPAGMAVRSFSGTGSTLSAIILGPPAGFCVSLGEAVPDLLSGGWGGGASAAGCEDSCRVGCAGGGAVSAAGGVASFAGGGDGTSRWGAGMPKSFDTNSRGGDGWKGAAGLSGGAKSRVSRALGGGVASGFFGVELSALSGGGRENLAASGVSDGPPEIRSGTFESMGGLKSEGGFSFVIVRRTLSGWGGLETIVMRGSKWLLPKGGCAPGFASCPGVLSCPDGLITGR